MTNKTLLIAATCLLGAFSLQACNKSEGGGEAQKTTGKIESAVGGLTGDEELKREGKKDEVVGGVKETVDDVKDTVKDAAH